MYCLYTSGTYKLDHFVLCAVEIKVGILIESRDGLSGKSQDGFEIIQGGRWEVSFCHEKTDALRDGRDMAAIHDQG